MIWNFTKMHGLGNDFVMLDGVRQSIDMTPQRARALAHRQFGIGCDQILLVDTPTILKQIFVIAYSMRTAVKSNTAGTARAVSLNLFTNKSSHHATPYARKSRLGSLPLRHCPMGMWWWIWAKPALRLPTYRLM